MGTVTIRSVPDHVHRRLKEKAAARGLSFGAYMRDWLQRVDDEASEEALERLSEQRKTRQTRR
jgi:plasmid stability protein